MASPDAFAETEKLAGKFALMKVVLTGHSSHPELVQLKASVPAILLVTLMVCGAVAPEPTAPVNVSPVLGLNVSPAVVPPLTVRFTVIVPVPPSESVMVTVPMVDPVGSTVMALLELRMIPVENAPKLVVPPFTSNQPLELLAVAV